MAEIIDIVNTIMEYKDKLTSIQETYVNKINEYANELKDLPNKVKKENKSDTWVENKKKTISEKMTNCVSDLKTSIDDAMSSIEEWYNEAINNVKTNIVKGNMAKIGVSVSDDMLAPLMDAIPHPAIASLLVLPEIKLPDIPEMPETKTNNENNITEDDEYNKA